MRALRSSNVMKQNLMYNYLMKKLLLAVFLFAGSILSTKAQQSSFWHPDRLTLSYFGSHFTHPGFKVEAEKVIWEKAIFKEKRQRSKQHQFIIGPSAGFYSHWRYQKGLFLQLTTGYRHIGHQGFTKEVRLGLGGLQTFIPNTFEVGEDGSLERKRFSGNTYLMPSVSLGLGKDIPDSDWGWHVRPILFWYVPHYPRTTMNIALEVGVSRRLG